MSARRCPACGAPLKPGMLLCREDWHGIPRVLQREVNAAWRAYLDAPTLETLRMYNRAAGRAERAARDALAGRAM